MSLYSSILMAGNSLQTNTIGLQVVGQNIANANTPGYIRERMLLEPASVQKKGGLLLGMGVAVEGVVQVIDQFLEERLRGAVSELSNSAQQEATFAELETIVGELSDTDLSSMMVSFFSSINEILNQPESRTVRNLSVLQGKTLAEEMVRTTQRVLQVRRDVNDQIVDLSDDINRLTEEIGLLNIQIANTEGGDISASDAVGLRDKRQQALEELASIMDIRVREQASGGVTVYAGSNFLVYEGLVQEVEVANDYDGALPTSSIVFKDSDMIVDPADGKLAGLISARDDILTGFYNELDEFSQTMIYEFNKVYSQGQGLNGYNQLESEHAVVDASTPLNEVGLPFSPKSGLFQVMVQNTQTGEMQTSDIIIDLDPYGQSTSLTDLATALDEVDGISASITAERHLKIESDSANQRFAFAGDTSGVLASLGINTFFSGTGALDIGVNEVVQDDPATFAASLGGIGFDTENAVALADFIDRPLTASNNATISELYDQLVNGVAQGSSVMKATAESSRVYESTLRGQKYTVSGVSIDEETVNLMAYQRAYQANARYISALDELLQIMVNL